MNNKLLSLFMAAFACISVSAQRYLSTAERDETTVKPAQMMTRTVETQSDGVIVTYQINAVSLTESGDENGTVRIGLDGFGSGYYAISLMIDGYPADTVRVVISK
jgi:hypothetical protein